MLNPVVASGRDRRKTTSQPAVIHLLMIVVMVIVIFTLIAVIAMAEILVFKMMRGLRVTVIGAASSLVGGSPLLMLRLKW